MTIYNQNALIERLADGVLASNQNVTMLIGSPISAPWKDGELGVPGVSDIVAMIGNEFFPTAIEEYRDFVSSSKNRYQSAFEYLVGRRGQSAANGIIVKAVLNARMATEPLNTSPRYKAGASSSDSVFVSLESDNDAWSLSPSLEAIGKIITAYPANFGKVLLTTNFDPLIEVSLKRAGGAYIRTVLHRDGNLSQSGGEGCNVVHLHGYWWGSDTLHTPRQLNQPRPRLKSSLASLVRNNILLVCGYGGWDDIINRTLVELSDDDQAFPELLWAVHGEVLPGAYEQLSALVDRGRLSVYTNVDCNVLFPSLLSRLRALSPTPEPSKVRATAILDHTIAAIPFPQKDLVEITPSRSLLLPEENDHPPKVDIYVGRESELGELKAGSYTVGVVTGIGGQGKSALAARYFSEEAEQDRFDYCVWRDCKEEAERFETQLARIVVAMGGFKMSARDAAAIPMVELIAIFFDQLKDKTVLLIFDNVDHYVDLENGDFIETPKLLIEAALKARTSSQFIFTCRSQISYQAEGFYSLQLRGLEEIDAIRLFDERRALASATDIKVAYELTGGHAFWLDLLAAQVAKRPEVQLGDLLHPMSVGSKEIPIETLQSIWGTLRDREHLVLRTLAETVRPTTEVELARFLDRKISYNKLAKAVAYLRSLNLLVFKSYGEGRDAIELHPVVRAFVRRTFPRAERKSFISLIISYYENVFLVKLGAQKSAYTIRDLQTWTESVELHVAAGNLDMAFDLLSEIDSSNLLYRNPREFIRVAKLLLDELDWDTYKLYKNFDRVISDVVVTLTEMGNIDDGRRLLARYRETIAKKTARYINYCNTYCYLEWAVGDFTEAVRWGREGRTLKDKGGVDTAFDTSHNLALSLRDSGEVDQALAYFLHGRAIEDVLDPEELDDQRDGSFYGNIGRCLQMMGQIDTALICYRKSAVLLENSRVPDPLNNQGHVRQWIGELLAAKGDLPAASRFLKAALRIWKLVSPIRERRLRTSIEGRSEIGDLADIDDSEAERYSVAWIFGRSDGRSSIGVNPPSSALR